jgi:hypothetical protein
MSAPSHDLFADRVRFSRSSAPALSDILNRLEGQSSMNAIRHTGWFTTTEITHEGHFLIDPYYGHAAIHMGCPGRAYLNTHRAGAVETRDRNIEAALHKAHYADARQRWCENPFMHKRTN